MGGVGVEGVDDGVEGVFAQPAINTAHARTAGIWQRQRTRDATGYAFGSNAAAITFIAL